MSITIQSILDNGQGSCMQSREYLFKLNGIFFFFVFVLLVTIVTISNKSLAENAPIELFSRMPHYYSTIVAQDDYTYTHKTDWSVKILAEQDLERNKKTAVTYSRSIEDIEILHAFTLKSDGRRLDAPKNNFQYQINTGSDENNPAFSDRSMVTVIFPDVEVGDSINFSYIITNKEPMFPGYFTSSNTYQVDYPYDDVIVTLDVPESFSGIYRIRQMSESIEKSQGRVKYIWKFQNKNPKKQNRNNYSMWKPEDSPGYEYSTFTSYKAIAEAYGKRAKPKSTVTSTIKDLAKQIVGDEVANKAKARLLYNWVAQNISYAGNCIGIGAVVPRDLDFVINNRMGDCKDHATLLEALLTAENIKSTQALINSGSIYYLSDVPMVNSVNHVINYLPEYDLYVDATNQIMPFGLISHSIADKPVLHIDDFEKGLRTPADKPSENTQTMYSEIDIADDGSAEVYVEVSVRGRNAAYARSFFRHTKKTDIENLVDNTIKRMGMTGSGRLENDDPTDLIGEFSYKVTMNIDRFINRPGTGAFMIYPPVFDYLPIFNFVDQANGDPVVADEVYCSNGQSIESYKISFADSMDILTKPFNVELNAQDIYYKADYSWSNQVLTVNREIRDLTKGNRCKSEYVNAQKNVTKKILDDLRQQIVYQ